MGTKPGAAKAFRSSPEESNDKHSTHFFLDRDADSNPDVKRLQEYIVRKLPAIRDHIRRTLGDDSNFPDYVDRLYRRLRTALESNPNLDESDVWSRVVSLVHEDRRRDRKRFSELHAVKIEENVDPTSLDFLEDLVRRDQFRAFRECLDQWTRRAFDFRYSSPHPRSSKEMAKAFDMKANAFDQRWKRGLDSARAEYLRRHGPWMP